MVNSTQRNSVLVRVVGRAPRHRQYFAAQVVVRERIREVSSDGVVTDSEIDYLRETLIGLVGGKFSDSGAIPAECGNAPN